MHQHLSLFLLDCEFEVTNCLKFLSLLERLCLYKLLSKTNPSSLH